jgi:hypothetical protein
MICTKQKKKRICFEDFIFNERKQLPVLGPVSDDAVLPLPKSQKSFCLLSSVH